jgi:hypothetical protein
MAEKRKGMSDEQLLHLIGALEKASLGSQVAAGATISTTIYPSNQAMPTLEVDRYNALNAYFARPLGNEIENRSQVVLPELRDTVEWIVPQLMRMFVAAKTVCRFEPDNPGDEDQAELETMVVNHVFMQENNGVILLQDFFKDALLLRNGYGEVYPKEAEEVTEERYTGIDELQVMAILQDKADETVEVLEQREYFKDVHIPLPQIPPTPLPQEAGLDAVPPAQAGNLVPKIAVFDLKIKRTQKVTRTCVVCLPPEEMRISSKTRGDLEDSSFTCHVTTKTRSDLRAEGYESAWVDSLRPGRGPEWLEMDALARNQVVDQLSIENPNSDPSMDEIELRRVVMRVDYDGDGIAELRRIVVGGDTIGENEMIEETPFVSCTPKRMPHRHTGISLYDELMDLQIIKTTIFRAALDNLTIANNSRIAVDWTKCNVDDLLTSRPGGAVRGEGPPANWIMPLEQPSNLTQQVLPALAYLDELKTTRTGIGKQMMSPDPDDLQNVTKSAQLAAVSSAALKVEMVARLLAEGVKMMFRKIHSTLMRHQDKPLMFELSGKWVEVDPSSWRRRTKVTVNVGLGAGNREEMRANVIMLSQMQMHLAQVGLVGPQQAYESFKLGCEALGFQNPERFAMDPSSQAYAQHMQQMQQMQAQAPPPPQVQAAKIKAQTTLLQEQAENQRAQGELQQKLMEGRLQLVHEAMQQKDQQIHEAKTAQNDRMHEALGGQADNHLQAQANQNDVVIQLLKILAPIVAGQLKGDESANAGEVLAEDERSLAPALDPNAEIHQRLSDHLDKLHEGLAAMQQPRTLTMPDGRQMRIE